jgi:hypothetical protein
MGPRHLWDPLPLGQPDTHEMLLDPSNTIKNVFQIKDLFFKVSLEFISKKTLNPLIFYKNLGFSPQGLGFETILVPLPNLDVTHA